MSVNQNFDEYPPTHFDEYAPTSRPSRPGGWWVAAVAAVIAVVGVFAFLSRQPPASAGMQAAHDRGIAEAQIDDAAYGAQLAAAHAAKSAEAATQGQARATETSAQAGAASAEATAQDASATAPAQQP